MKRSFSILLTFAITTISTTAIALPEGAIARLGKGEISWHDRAVQFSPDGKLLAVATSIGVWLYDAQTHEEVTLLETTTGMSSVVFSPDGTLLASGSGWPEYEIKLWNPSTGQLIDTLTGHSSDVYSVSFNHDGTLLANGSEDGTALLWDMGPYSGKIIYGDVNDDGQVTPADAVLVMQHVVGEVTLNSEQQIRADVTNDGTLSCLDAALILQKITGLILEFPVQSTPLSH